MARTTGPLFSQQASGSLGKILTMSSWKGRSYTKKLGVPSNPDSNSQRNVRITMGFCSSAFSKTLSPAEQATWAGPATAKQLSPLNAMIGENLSRFSQNQVPIGTPNPPAAPTDSNWAQLPTPHGQVNSILIDWDITTLNDTWGLFVLAAPDPIDPAVSGPIRLGIAIAAAGPGSGTILPCQPGLWNTFFFTFSKDATFLSFGSTGGLVVT